MKPKHALRNFLALAGSSLLAMSSANAVTYYWDSTTPGTTAGFGSTDGTWGTSTFWSTGTGASAGTASTANTTTNLQDDLNFGSATDGYTGTITVNGTRNARLLTFGAASGAVTLTSGTIVLGSGGGITVAAGAANDATISSNLTINGAQTFTVGTSRTLLLDTGTFTRNAGSVLSIQNSGTLTSTMTGLATGSMVNGIVGPWASIGTGTSTRYATFTGSNITALTGTAAATGADLTDTTGTVNYDLTVATGTVPTSMSANTIRYAGGSATTAPGATLFSVNGLMYAGSGTWTIGANQVTIGATKELVVNATSTATNAMTISGTIADNALGSSTLLKTGDKALTLSGSNSYTGATTIVQGSISTGSLANAGSNSGIGAFATAGATGLLLHGGLFTYTGATTTTNRGFTFGTTGSATGGTINVSTAGAVLTMGNATINSTGALTVSGGTGSSLALGTVTQYVSWTITNTNAVSINAITLGASAANLTPSTGLLTVGDITGTDQNYQIGGGGGNITGNIALGTGSLQKAGAGTWTLTGLSSYSGTTTLNGNSTVNFNSIANVGGGNSALGAPTTPGNGTIAFNNGTLRYIGTGTGHSSNRVINMGFNAPKLEMAGTGTLKFTSDLTTTSNTVKTLTLTGSTAGIGELGGAIQQYSSTSTTSVTKDGTGTWILSGTSTYTGATLVSAGTLLVNGSLGNSAVTVNGGAFGGTGTIGSTLGLNSGSSFHVVDLSDWLTVTGTVTIYAGFGVDDLVGLNWGTMSTGTYTLISGDLGSGVFAGLANNSLGSAYTDVGSGKSAYFEQGSLKLVVIPEPGAALIGSFGLLALLRRRRY